MWFSLHYLFSFVYFLRFIWGCRWPLKRVRDGAACVFADWGNALHSRFQGIVPLLNPFQRQQIGDVIFVDVFYLADSFPVRDLACRDFNIGKPLAPGPDPPLRSDVSYGMLFSCGSGYCRSCKIQSWPSRLAAGPKCLVTMLPLACSWSDVCFSPKSISCLGCLVTQYSALQNVRVDFQTAMSR